MFVLVFITIAAIYLAYVYVSSDKSPCTEPDRDAESCSQLTEAATLWNQIKLKILTRFSDGRNKFRLLLEDKHCWPDDMNGIPNSQQNAERATKKDNKCKGIWTTVREDSKQNIYR